MSTNSLIHVAQTSRRIVLPVNGWIPRVSDISTLVLSGSDLERDMQLEGAEAVFVTDRTLFVVLKEGVVYPVEISADGRTVEKLTVGAPIARTTIPSVIRRGADDHLFVGSTVGPSVLLKTVKVEEAIPEEDADMATSPTAVVDASDGMDLDDDDGTHASSIHRPPSRIFLPPCCAAQSNA